MSMNLYLLFKFATLLTVITAFIIHYYILYASSMPIIKIIIMRVISRAYAGIFFMCLKSYRKTSTNIVRPGLKYRQPDVCIENY